MKPGLELPFPGKNLKDLHKVGQCVICHVPLYRWDSQEPVESCADFGPAPDCAHPDDLCKSPECAEKRRKHYAGKRKLKNPCGFPRLRDKVTG